MASVRSRSTGNTTSWENPFRLIARTRTVDMPSVVAARRVESQNPDVRALE